MDKFDTEIQILEEIQKQLHKIDLSPLIESLTKRAEQAEQNRDRFQKHLETIVNFLEIEWDASDFPIEEVLERIKDKKMNQIFVFRIQEWACLYVNGENELEDHNISVFDLEKYCPIESIKVKEGSHFLDEYVMKNQKFPDTLEEALKINKGL